MSFILDALKKVEKRKTGSGEIRVAEEVLVPRRARRYGGTAVLIGIAVLSAFVTAGAMHFFAGEASEPVSASVSEASSPAETAAIPEAAPASEPQLQLERTRTRTRTRYGHAPARAPAFAKDFGTAVPSCSTGGRARAAERRDARRERGRAGA